MNRKQFIFSARWTSILAACGGGGGSKGNAAPGGGVGSNAPPPPGPTSWKSVRIGVAADHKLYGRVYVSGTGRGLLYSN